MTDYKRMTPEQAAETFSLRGGTLVWAKPGKAIKVGGPAGSVAPTGYVLIGRQKLMAHRVVWCITHGRWPAGEIDHINGDRADNRPENLREATKAQNGCNRGRNKNNKSGFKGVFLDAQTGRWQAGIHVGGKRIFLGRFDSPAEAGAAYARAAPLYHGEFARAN